MDNPIVENMTRFGHTSRECLIEEMQSEHVYLEDIYGTEIKLGDSYFETELGKVHEKNALTYMKDMYLERERG